MAGKTSRKPKKREYRRPEMRKRERLSQVAQGAPPPVTDGGVKI
jgi:hypothetical protein